MARRYKILFGFLIILIVVCTGWVFLFVFYPGKEVPEGTPLTIRLPALAYSIPGIDHAIAWEARRDAQRDFHAGRRYLLGAGPGGISFGFQNQCQVLDYDETTFREQDIPLWSTQGLNGTVQLACRDAQSVAAETFGVVEIGCIDERGSHFYSREHNKRMLALSLIQNEGVRLQFSRTVGETCRLQVRTDEADNGVWIAPFLDYKSALTEYKSFCNDSGNLPVVTTGLCDDGRKFVTISKGLSSEMQIFASDNSFISLRTQPDYSFSYCMGNYYWPDRSECANPRNLTLICGMELPDSYYTIQLPPLPKRDPWEVE